MTHPRTRSAFTAATAAAALALLLSSCSTATAESSEYSEPDTSAWPRTIEVPAGAGGAASTLTLEAAPQAIAALDYESAEVIAELGLSEHLVLVPEAVLNPALGSHLEQMAEVSNTFPVAMEVDAETVISLDPDLVVLSPRHHASVSIAEVLQQAGIPTLQLPAPWTDPETLSVGVELIGAATGTEAAASELNESIADGLEQSSAPHTAEASPHDAPKVLVLTNQAGRPFLTAGAAYPLALLKLAGAEDSSADLDRERTGPISAEQIVQAAPDGIVLIDMNGTGDRMFTELLENSAVTSLPAVSQNRILRVEGKQVQALGLKTTVDGLDTLTEWVKSLPQE